MLAAFARFILLCSLSWTIDSGFANPRKKRQKEIMGVTQGPLLTASAAGADLASLECLWQEGPQILAMEIYSTSDQSLLLGELKPLFLILSSGAIYLKTATMSPPCSPISSKLNIPDKCLQLFLVGLFFQAPYHLLTLLWDTFQFVSLYPKCGAQNWTQYPRYGLINTQ